mmetsp:Transcript_8348/g.17579  ORF Transcript_8348/g.17579 Transcript_8348/m.17579 type:complete len:104 (-) Transcript_8348:180-491(-)
MEIDDAVEEFFPPKNCEVGTMRENATTLEGRDVLNIITASKAERSRATQGIDVGTSLFILVPLWQRLLLFGIAVVLVFASKCCPRQSMYGALRKEPQQASSRC